MSKINLSKSMVEEFRGNRAIHVGHMITVDCTEAQREHLWVLNSKDDEWLITAEGEAGEKWASLVCGTDDDGSKKVVVSLLMELIAGCIIDGPIEKSIRVLKHSDYIGLCKAYDVTKYAMKAALNSLSEDDIPDSFEIKKKNTEDNLVASK